MGRMMKNIEVVAAIIQNNSDELLATQRGYGEWKEWWEFPGGKIETGEDLIHALKREIQEELDAEIEVGTLFHTVEYDYPAYHLTMHCFFCRLVGALTLKEHKAAKWLKIDELDTINWLPADVEVIEKLKNFNK